MVSRKDSGIFPSESGEFSKPPAVKCDWDKRCERWGEVGRAATGQTGRLQVKKDVTFQAAGESLEGTLSAFRSL